MRVSTLAWECCLFLFTGFADEYERLLEAVLSMVLETCGCATAAFHLCVVTPSCLFGSRWHTQDRLGPMQHSQLYIYSLTYP
ncbi:hypothetical protein I7I48_08853 [Histoplasma ohiense]|nr:hypothetical protein I7I48_08853 [Histoplasma ohiense (nom. inval.)]